MCVYMYVHVCVYMRVYVCNYNMFYISKVFSTELKVIFTYLLYIAVLLLDMLSLLHCNNRCASGVVVMHWCAIT